MAGNTVPITGRWGAIYRLRPSGFEGVGLNDLTWGTTPTPGNVSFYVEIDAVGATDTFKWRIGTGDFTEGVAITGATQLLNGAQDQNIAFAATTGHTLGDHWILLIMDDAETTVDGNTAQITTSTFRMVNPNDPPVWTPTNSVQLLSVDYVQGIATFDGAPGVTTVTGVGSASSPSLQKVGYVQDWSLDVSRKLLDTTSQGMTWAEAIEDTKEAKGSAKSFFIGSNSFFDDITNSQKYFFIQLFTNDPSVNQSGNRFSSWVSFSDLKISGKLGSVCDEGIDFTCAGNPVLILD